MFANVLKSFLTLNHRTKMNILMLAIVCFAFGSVANGAYFCNSELLFTNFFSNPIGKQLTKVDATSRMTDSDPNLVYFTDLKEIAVKAFAESNVRYFFLENEKDYLLRPKAFMNAYALRWLDVGGVQTIPEQCFENCLDLKIVMGKNVRKINIDAFWNCHEIQLLYFPNLQEVDPDAFRGSSVLFLILPQKFIQTLEQTIPQEDKIILLPAEQFDYLDALCLTDVYYF